MKEGLKTVLLVVLILLAIFFAYEIGTVRERKIKHRAEETEVLKGTSYLLSEILLPKKELVSFNEKYRTVVYSSMEHRLWKLAQTPIGKLLSGDYSVKTLESTEELRSRYVAFQFPDVVNTYILARAFSEATPNSIPREIPEVVELTVYLGRSTNTIVLTASDGTKKAAELPKSEFAAFEEHMSDIEASEKHSYFFSLKESLNVAHDLYFPYNAPGTVAGVYVENQLESWTTAEKRKLAKRFFTRDPEYIQEIEEPNGSMLFIYNKDVLKIHENGVLEYLQPLRRDSRNPNLYESLKTALDFISEKSETKLPIYLESARPVEYDGNKGYLLRFQYRASGLAVLYRHVDSFLEVEVYNDQIRGYRHSMRTEVEADYKYIAVGDAVISAQDILDNHFELFRRAYLEAKKIAPTDAAAITPEQVISWIEDVDLCYYDESLKLRNARLIPVWVFQTDDRYFEFDAKGGNLVFVRERAE